MQLIRLKPDMQSRLTNSALKRCHVWRIRALDKRALLGLKTILTRASHANTLSWRFVRTLSNASRASAARQRMAFITNRTRIWRACLSPNSHLSSQKWVASTVSITSRCVRICASLCCHYRARNAEFCSEVYTRLSTRHKRRQKHHLEPPECPDVCRTRALTSDLSALTSRFERGERGRHEREHSFEWTRVPTAFDAARCWLLHKRHVEHVTHEANQQHCLKPSHRQELPSRAYSRADLLGKIRQ